MQSTNSFSEEELKFFNAKGITIKDTVHQN
jgi:hypothetical protein